MRDRPSKLVSVVVPCYNEAAVVGECVDRLAAVFAPLPHDHELVFVDDGSTDATALRLADLARQDPRVKVVTLSRNFGQQRAISAGLEFSRGDYIVVMDADLQDPPELIPQLIEPLDAGDDVVHAVRSDRSVDGWFKRASAWAFYRLMRRWVLPALPENSGDFKAFNRRVCDALCTYRERVRFLRGAIATLGYRQSEVSYVRAARGGGRSKYPLKAVLRFARDAIVSNTVLPLRAALYLGLATLATAGAAAAVFAYALLTGASSETLLFGVAILLVLGYGGATMTAIGALGEYIKVLMMEVKHRPLYHVRELTNVYADPTRPESTGVARDNDATAPSDMVR